MEWNICADKSARLDIRYYSSASIITIRKTYKIRHYDIDSVIFFAQYINHMMYDGTVYCYKPILDSSIFINGQLNYVEIKVNELANDYDIMNDFMSQYQYLHETNVVLNLYNRHLPIVSTMRDYINANIHKEMRELRCLLAMI